MVYHRGLSFLIAKIVISTFIFSRDCSEDGHDNAVRRGELQGSCGLPACRAGHHQTHWLRSFLQRYDHQGASLLHLIKPCFISVIIS